MDAILDMADIERVTITLPAEIAAAAKGAAAEGDYASANEVVREALRAAGFQLKARLNRFR